MILDSSVIFKWFYKEEDSDKALSLYQSIKVENTPLSLPRLLYYEIGNAVLYHKPFSREKLDRAEEILRTIPINFHDFTFSEWRRIIKSADHYSVSFYDFTYIYLAERLQTYLITADSKLFTKTKKLGLVKLL